MPALQNVLAVLQDLYLQVLRMLTQRAMCLVEIIPAGLQEVHAVLLRMLMQRAMCLVEIIPADLQDILVVLAMIPFMLPEM